MVVSLWMYNARMCRLPMTGMPAASSYSAEWYVLALPTLVRMTAVPFDTYRTKSELTVAAVTGPGSTFVVALTELQVLFESRTYRSGDLCDSSQPCCDPTAMKPAAGEVRFG
jgi:hypothetical protein